MKNKAAERRVGAAKSKHKAIKARNKPWALKPKQKVNSIMRDYIKKSFHNWINNHTQVVQSPIVNDCLKLNIGGHAIPQIVPKLLLHVSVAH